MKKDIIKRSSRGRLANGEPNPIDIHVGERIRLRRTLLGLSQEKLANMLGLTFQQVQKYERGMNRVGASRLWDISKVLSSPINFFYEDMDQAIINESPRMLAPFSNNELEALVELNEHNDPMQSAETIELVKAYYKISNRKTAQHLFKMIKEMAKSINYADVEDAE